MIGRPLVMAYLHPKQIVTHRRPCTLKRQLTSLVYYLFCTHTCVYPFYHSFHSRIFTVFNIKYSCSSFFFFFSSDCCSLISLGFALINRTKIIYYCVHTHTQRSSYVNVVFLYIIYELSCSRLTVYAYKYKMKKKNEINK